MIKEELETSNAKIKALEEELEKEKEKRHKLHIDYCENVIDHEARARVISHEFSDDNCPRNGYTSFEVEVYNYRSGEIILRDEFSDYYEMPLLSGDPESHYCCGMFQLNREVIAWDVTRGNKHKAPYYQAIVWAIEKYIHDNHLGCGMCE